MCVFASIYLFICLLFFISLQGLEPCDTKIFSSLALQQEIYGQVTVHDARSLRGSRHLMPGELGSQDRSTKR